MGLFARLRNLLRGTFALWIRDGERGHPRAVYEQAIEERTRQYHELKEAVAGILFMRNKLDAEIAERRAEIARLHEDVRRAVRAGQDELSVALIALPYYRTTNPVRVAYSWRRIAEVLADQSGGQA